MTRELAKHEYHRERLECNEKIGNRMPCKMEEMWKVCEGYVKGGIVVMHTVFSNL